MDKKLQKLRQVKTKALWKDLVFRAYKASYGFECSGDSLLIARKNLLFTYLDYYLDKWHKEPPITDLKKIATIISYSIFQMDGLKGIIPLSEPKDQENIKSPSSQGTRVKIMNRETNKLEYFQ
ncbi:hypothetical protein [Psittacicella hinzii]|uniref:Uncharacterized protein n=1 Tax=Psittacicella hinzii TaxID=2028575 RepID=A0A3A1YG34_9GAMM|nr:hypothetical protein [Psittacicella hinzii]RIY34997.1 hypothetical protein CKF58_07290 [Psittacicella hinzii]